MTQIRIVRIHNELLGTYGDQGNAEVLAFRAKFHGITASVIDVSYMDSIPPNGDIYLLGGAEDSAQILSLHALQRQPVLHDAVADGAVVLAICAGFQIIGKEFWANEKKVQGLGLLDVTTVPGKKRFVGEMKSRSSILNLELSGFENHAGKTLLGSDVQAFSKVSSGFGNGDGRTDGAISGNVYGTYMHGPVLARNPAFADLLLTRAARQPFNQINDPLAVEYAKAAMKY